MVYYEVDESFFLLGREFGMEKHSFEINIPVPAIVGAITGAGVANKTMKNQLAKQQEERDNTVILSGDYYHQVDNMANNMKVTFTPFSVIYSLKNGPMFAQFETIPTESMNRDMYVAWQNRDSVYFKNLLLNKIKAEIQFAEQQYARNIINKHLEMGKQAGYDFAPFEVFHYADNLYQVYQKENMDKVAAVMLTGYEDEIVKIALTIEDPKLFSNTIGGDLSFMKIRGNNNLDEMQGKFLSPRYLKLHGKVAFLPDRVLFIVDNLVVTSLLAFDMNAEAFDRFEAMDHEYFLDHFEREGKMGLRRMAAKLPEKKNLNKEAAAIVIDIKDIFVNNFVHPLIYYKTLTDKYTVKWLSFDARALVKILETDFELIEPICDIALNKILASQAVNETVPPFTVPHAFEKMIRSFVELPINWMIPQSDDITPEQFAYGLECFDIVTPDNDTYDDFDEEVFTYLIKNLSRSNVKIFAPDRNMSRSLEHMEFFQVLNEFLLNTNEATAIEGITDLKQRADIIEREDKLYHALDQTLSAIKENKVDINEADLKKTLIENGCPDEILDLALEEIRRCLEIDLYLVRQNDILSAQMEVYGIAVS